LAPSGETARAEAHVRKIVSKPINIVFVMRINARIGPDLGVVKKATVLFRGGVRDIREKLH